MRISLNTANWNSGERRCRLFVLGVTISTLVVGMTGCAQDGSNEPSESEKEMIDSRSSLNEVKNYVGKFEVLADHNCASPYMHMAVVNGRIIEAIAGKISRSLHNPNDYSNVQMQLMMTELNEIDPMALAAKFIIADAYLKAKCWNEADAQYREIIDTYIGSSFAAMRQRALIGIEDVRSLRSKN